MGLAEEELQGRGPKLWLARGAIAVVLLALTLGAAAVLKDIISVTSSPARQVAKISLVPDMPPPPPPPPPKQETPESPKEQKQVQEAPKAQDAPQPSEQLKMEGQGSDSGLAGLQAGSVTQDYRGQAIGGTATYVWYGNMVQRELQQHLQKVPKLRGADYRVMVRLWLSPAGEITRVEIAGSSGDGDLDQLLRTSLAGLPPLKDSPPADMPQPIRLRLVSRT